MRKAQISLGLTWMIGFLIIFFIIILFISSTFILSQRKKIDINIQEYKTKELELQRKLIKFLDKPINFEGQEMRIKHLIILWDNGNEKENIEKKLKEELNLEFPIYFLE